MYPAGVSTAEFLDMAGTVWEWCVDSFETSETRGGTWLGRSLTKPPTEQERRVLRGGSWYDLQDFARAANRSGNNPAAGTSTSVSVLCVRPHLPDTDP